MRIAMIALGSRGDVQPYIALGKGLKKAGHAVRLITHENFERSVTVHGLDFWAVKGNVQEAAESEEMRRLLEKGNFLAITRQTAKLAQEATLQWAGEGLAGCAGMDLLVTGLGGLFIGLAFAEKLDLPLVQAHVIPFTPTGAFPGALMPVTLPGSFGPVNRWSHRLTRQMMWQGYRQADNMARREVLDLPPAAFGGPFNSARFKNSAVLYGFSPAVIPRPADWPVHAQVTGYWFLEQDAQWSPPDSLVKFLADGAPPVVIGFGSMSSRNPQESMDLVLQALADSGQRGVILSGWGGFQGGGAGDTVHVIEAAPHDWLFRQAAAVVHHGGAGTTAAGFKAGVPSIVVPFFGDQPFWGTRAAMLGVGPRPIPRGKLTAERLAHAIRQAVEDQEMIRRAASLGEKIRQEDGIGNAVAALEDLFPA